jgi:hypothetical protein
MLKELNRLFHCILEPSYGFICNQLYEKTPCKLRLLIQLIVNFARRWLYNAMHWKSRHDNNGGVTVSQTMIPHSPAGLQHMFFLYANNRALFFVTQEHYFTEPGASQITADCKIVSFVSWDWMRLESTWYVGHYLASCSSLR